MNYYKDTQEPEGQDAIESRLHELKALIGEIPKEIEELERFLLFYSEEERKWTEAADKLKLQNKNKEKVRRLVRLESPPTDSDDEKFKEEETQRKAVQSKREEDKEDGRDMVRFECGHIFKKREVKRVMERRTDKRNVMSHNGEKCFKCLEGECYHILTEKEVIMTLGYKEWK